MDSVANDRSASPGRWSHRLDHYLTGAPAGHQPAESWAPGSATVLRSVAGWCFQRMDVLSRNTEAPAQSWQQWHRGSRRWWDRRWRGTIVAPPRSAGSRLSEWRPKAERGRILPSCIAHKRPDARSQHPRLGTVVAPRWQLANSRYRRIFASPVEALASVSTSRTNQSSHTG